MDALLFALILEVVLHQIHILEGCAKLRAQCWNINTKNAPVQFEKMARDRDTVKDVACRTLIEFVENREFQTLRNAVDILKARATSAISMKQIYEQSKKTRKELCQELEEKRAEWTSKLREADFTTSIIRDKMNDAQQNTNMRLTYADKWLLARMEGLELEWQKPRPTLPDMNNELRVHAELLRAYDMQIKEREESMAHWEQKYSTDLADIKERLAAKTEAHRLVKAKREELQKLFDLHSGEMRAWLTFKRERAARLAREESLRRSATRIQAWWRGTMVRRGLGAYRFMNNLKKAHSKKKK